MGIEVVRQELKAALSDTAKNQTYSFTRPIRNERTAVSAVEPILYRIYGENNIINEKPYEVYQINGYWVMMGTLPKQMLGGTFLIIVSAKDGRVIKLTHGK